MEIETLNEHDTLIIRYNGEMRRAIVNHVYLAPADETEDDCVYVKVGADLDGYQEEGFGTDECLTEPGMVVCKVRLMDYRELPDVNWVELCARACEWNHEAFSDANWSEVLEKPHKWLNEAWLAGFDIPPEHGTLREVIERAQEQTA